MSEIEKPESMSTPRREIILHDGPGKGKKQCPQCKVFVGVRTQDCVCGYNWEKKAVAVSAPISSQSDGPGKGKKQCPKCKSYTGVRTAACGCGFIWAPKEEIVEEPKETQYRERFISTPAGLCPVKLSGMTASINNPKNDPVAPEELYEWADKLVSLGQLQSVRYTPAALKYWLRHFYDMYTPLWREAVAMLQIWTVNNNPVPEFVEESNG